MLTESSLPYGLLGLEKHILTEQSAGTMLEETRDIKSQTS